MWMAGFIYVGCSRAEPRAWHRGVSRLNVGTAILR
jgi:hypothetical protein